ncbi:MAG TPA: ABC transporter ATP-binding protein [Nocardioidaceae bacterium]|nr:ABC transporter ATP-binding protein/permease [Actinomycetota bacterium]HEV8054878.1 ABC transporter ATP-binding protein [Nocardioidaceae bacterium]
MRQLPLADPGTPDARSPGRYLWWIARNQLPTLAGGIVFGTVWMVSQALMPAIIGRAIDTGVAAQDTGALLYWATVLAMVGLFQAVAGIARHRFAVANWLTAAYRTVQVVTRHATHLGATLPKRVATGEVVSIGATDLAHIGNTMDVLGRAAGAIVSFLVVAVILLNASTTLGLVVLLGVPLLLVAIGPLLRPLQRRNMAHREMMGELNTLAGDIVGGLRVLRGIGGEEVFSDRYRRESQRVRGAGMQVGRLQSVLDGLQILLPGIFVVIIVWLGARFALQDRISPGQLVAFYGYAAFLLIPLRTATEFANKYIRGLVAARRVCTVLSLTSEIVDPEAPAEPRAAPPTGGALVDHSSGVRIAPGRITAIVSDESTASSAIADRLGRYADGDVTLSGVRLDSLPRETVRERVLVSDTAATLFSGRLREQLRGGANLSDHELARAIDTASADDVLETLPEGLDAEVEERGRSLSGGQRQRLVLVRALLADPEVLVLVEPTSAVDAHTEARIADRLSEHRAGRTTAVVTASPLLLDRVDHVQFVHEGRVVAQGEHRELLRSDPRYRRVVTRGEDE